jgi:serine phosphatase RsbU (regulator of sigma subunit)
VTRRSERHDAQIACVVVVLLGLFGLRLAGVSNAGSLELVAVGIAAWWFGRLWALWTGGAATALLVVATLVEEGIPYEALVVHGALIMGGAWLLGWLFDERRRQGLLLRRAEPVQNALAPSRPPDLPLLEIATRYVPASADIGGDFYLVAEGHNNATIVVIADVVGKGVEAAKRATFVRATMSASGSYSQDPAHLLRIANAELVRQYGLSAQFITMLCAVVRPDAMLSWCTAGHPPPLSMADGSPVGKANVSLPLGIAPDLEEIDVWRGELPEAGIVMYTDGLSDARPAAGSFPPLGHDRIGLFLRELENPTPDEAADRLISAAQTFTGGPLPDDLCLVALRSKLPRRPLA